MLDCCLNLIFVVALAPPIADLQGDWEIRACEVREPGEDMPRLVTYGGQQKPLWRVQGTWVEVTHRTAVVLRLAGDPNAFPAGIRFVDYEGLDYTGSYSLTGGKLVLTLLANAPVKGLVNTNGTKYLTITLVRPRPHNPNPFSLKKTYDYTDPR